MFAAGYTDLITVHNFIMSINHVVNLTDIRESSGVLSGHVTVNKITWTYMTFVECIRHKYSAVMLDL